MQEIISKFTPSDWIAIIAIIASVILTLGGICLTQRFAIRNENKRAREEFIDKEITPLLVYTIKLSGLDKQLREETTEDILDERLGALHATYIDLFFKLKDHLDNFITNGKMRYLIKGKKANLKLLDKLTLLNGKFAFYSREMPFVISKKPLELNLPTDITYRDYESIQGMLATLERNI